jgi:hypothetical protein
MDEVQKSSDSECYRPSSQFSSVYWLYTSFLLDLIFDPDDGDILLLNTLRISTACMKLHPKSPFLTAFCITAFVPVKTKNKAHVGCSVQMIWATLLEPSATRAEVAQFEMRLSDGQ